jgi:glycosyltransferase involved in cell wall biosynthesis
VPKISVVIPSYNHARFVSQAVRSVLDQTEKDLELIVVDDGSTDNSQEVLSTFSDPRLQVVSQSNQGAHAAINHGLDMASGKYLSILNSDDVYHPERFFKMIPVLETNASIGLMGSFVEVVDADNKPLGVKKGYKNLEPWSLTDPERSFRAGDSLQAALLTENYFATTSNFIFCREWYERLGGFRPLRYAHDWDFALRLAKQSHLHLFPEALMGYRVHSQNTIRDNQVAMIFEICWILAVHLPANIGDGWFKKYSGGKGVDQLLHSIYAFGMERVLNVMLLQRLSEDPETALKLLEPENAERRFYLEFIERQLTKEDPVPGDSPGARSPQEGEKPRKGPGLLRKLLS